MMKNNALAESIAVLDSTLYIDGKFSKGKGPRLPVLNPATGEVIGHIAAATTDEIDAAVFCCTSCICFMV